MLLTDAKIMIVGESRGSSEVLEPLARELLARGFCVEIVATGTVAEAVGFADLKVHHIDDRGIDPLIALLQRCDLLMVGITGAHSLEAKLCAIARSHAVISIGVLDNIDNISARFPADPSAYPDLCVLSGRMPAAWLTQDPIPRLIKQNRFLMVDNLRREAALRRQRQFFQIGQSHILHQALTHCDTFVPHHLNVAKLLPDILSGSAKVVVFYSQNVPPSSRCWRSYGHSEGELVENYASNLMVTSKALIALSRLSDVHAAVRPHPREGHGISFEIAKELGAIYLPPQAGHSMDLAMAAGYVVTPSGSMIDQGPFHGVRTAALLFEQNGPFPYESLLDGSAVCAHQIGEVESTLRFLTGDDPIARSRWSKRLQSSSRVVHIAAAALDDILRRLAAS